VIKVTCIVKNIAFILFVVLSSPLSASAFNPSDNVHIKEACDSCHKIATPVKGNAALKANDSTELCMSCHKNPKFMHQVKIEKPHLEIYKEFPVEGKLMGCATCHEEAKCRGKPDLGRHYLRSGPYNKLEDFCYKCHTDLKVNLSKINPHLYHKGSTAPEEMKACFYCHAVDPTMVKITADDPKLKIKAEKLCLVCHTRFTHLLADEHLGKSMPQEKLNNLKAAIGETKVELRLEKGNIVTCSTCHYPHATHHIQPEDKKPDHWFSAYKKKADVVINKSTRIRSRILSNTLRLPVEKNALCKACHGY